MEEEKEFGERDLLAEASALIDEKELSRYPSLLVGNPVEQRTDELWRCQRCAGNIRTNEDIRKGDSCKHCGSRMVTPAVPSRWETIKLFFRTGTIFLPEKGEVVIHEEN